MPMKVAIVGTGGAAASNARSIQKVEGLALWGICSSDPARGRAFAERFGGRYYPSVKHIAESRDIDVAVIASIPDQHEQHLGLLLDHVPIIFVEKPLGLTAAQALSMRKMAQSSRSAVAVLYKHRFDQAYDAIRRMLEAGEFGRIIGVTLSVSQQRGQSYFDEHGGWRSRAEQCGGGVLLQQGIHWINFLFGLFGYQAQIASVTTLEDSIRSMEDFASVNFIHEHGFSGSLVFSRATASLPTSLCIFGTEASLRYDTHALSVFRSRTSQQADTWRAPGKLPFIPRRLIGLFHELPAKADWQRRTRLGRNDDVMRYVVQQTRRHVDASFCLEDAVRDQQFVEAALAAANSLK